LPENTYKETIKLTSVISQGNVPDIYIDVYINAIYDNRDNRHKYYRVVQIGTQTWMAENLNVGTRIDGTMEQTNNYQIEKYCYLNNELISNIYGGLYQWPEAMQYYPSDDKVIGTTQGICPIDWHLPTSKEWSLLSEFLGGWNVAGGKLKETGITHWSAPNPASDDYGFSALGGGFRSIDLTFYYLNLQASFWASDIDNFIMSRMCYLENGNTWLIISGSDFHFGLAVRCVKDPPKK
jgi:uncharacterized protein (TIGR02145 family)